MIELRWKAYVSHSDPETGEHFTHPSKYRKLQYRTLGARVQTGIMEWTQAWSEWHDVPTERHDDIERSSDG